MCVPASLPLYWSDPEIFYASGSLVYSSLDGKGLSSLCNPRCTCFTKDPLLGLLLTGGAAHCLNENKRKIKKVTRLFAQTTEQNLLEPLKV